MYIRSGLLAHKLPGIKIQCTLENIVGSSYLKMSVTVYFSTVSSNMEVSGIWVHVHVGKCMTKVENTKVTINEPEPILKPCCDAGEEAPADDSDGARQ